MIKLPKKLLIVGIIVAVFLFAFKLSIENQYSKNYLKNKISAFISQSLNLKVTFDSLIFNPLTLSLKISNVKIYESLKKELSKPLWKIKEIGVSPAIIPLILGKAQTLDIEIDDIDLKWPLSDKNIEIFKRPKHSNKKRSAKFKHIIHSVSIHNSSFIFKLNKTNNPLPNVIKLDQINTSFVFSSQDNLEGKINIASANFALGEKKIFDHSKFSALFALNNFDQLLITRVKLNDKILKTKKGQINVKTLYKEKKLSSIKIIARAFAQIDLSLLERILGWKKTHGKITADATTAFHIPIANPEEFTLDIKGHFKSHNAYLNNIKLHETESNFHATTEQLTFNKIKLVVNSNQVGEFKGKLHFNDNVKFDFLGSLTDMNLKDIVGLFSEEKFNAVNFKTYASTLQIKGTGKPFNLQLNGDGLLEDLNFPSLKKTVNTSAILPTCHSRLSLIFDDNKMDFNNTKLVCFLKTEKETLPLSVLELPFPNPPKSSTAQSHLSLNKYLHWDFGPDIEIVSNSFNLDVASRFNPVKSSGFGIIKTKIFNDADHTIINNSFKFQNTKVLDVDLGTVKGVADFKEDQVKWINLNSEFNGEKLEHFSGIYNWERNNLSLKGEIYQTPLSKFNPILSEYKSDDIDFFIDSTKFEAVLNPINLKDLSLSISSILKNTSYKKRRVFPSMSFSFNKDKKLFNVDNVYLDTGLFSVQGKGSIDKFSFDSWFHPKDQVDFTFNHDLKPTQKTPVPFNNLVWFAKQLKGITGQGIFNISGKLRGEVGNLKGSFLTEGTNLSFNNTPLENFEIKTYLNNNTLDSFLKSKPSNRLAARLKISLEEELKYNTFVLFNQFDLRSLFANHFIFDARSFGYLTAKAKLEGSLNDFWNSKGYINLDELFIKHFSHELVGENSFYLKLKKPIKALLANTKLKFEKNSPLELEGLGVESKLTLGRTSLPNFIDLKSKSFVNLMLLKKLSNTVGSTKGELELSMNLSGSIKNPNLELAINNSARSPKMTIKLLKYRPALRDIQIAGHLKKGRLIFSKFSAKKGAGKIEIRGDINFNKFPRKLPLNLQIFLDNTPITIDSKYFFPIDSSVNGRLRLTGGQSPYTLEGTIDIERAISRANSIETKKGFYYLYNYLKTEEMIQSSEDPLLNFNITLAANENLVLRNSITELFLSTNLTLSGTNVRPIFLGKINMNEGKFFYQREFIINTGEVVLDGKEKNEAKINIVASTIVAPYTVTIIISGSTSQPIVNLAVDPPTKEDGSTIEPLEAIILLTKGSLPSKTEYSQNAKGIATTTAVNYYTSQLPFDIFNEITGQNFISPFVNYTLNDEGTPVLQWNFPIQVSKTIDATVKSIPSKTQLVISLPVNNNISILGSATSRTKSETNVQALDTNVNLKFSFPFR